MNWYDGTVEGQPAYDAGRGVLYVGRSDGKLYAIDENTGEIRWRYVTFNPDDPDDPDGGGEIVTAPLFTDDGTVYFGTWGEGGYETNAFYAVNPNGSLRWRWPADDSIPHRFYASPALSADGRTVYASTFTDGGDNNPSSLYAFHHACGALRAASPLRWEMELSHAASSMFTTTLAVGSDGTVYVGGYISRGFGTVPVLAAIRDNGPNRPPEYVWETSWVELENGAQFIHGIGLREESGHTTRLYITTANLGTVIFNGKEEGELYAVDPTSGIMLAEYDPSDATPQAVGSLTSPAIGANGVVYVGVRGRFGNSAVNGHVQAVAYDEQERRFSLLWDHDVDGHIEWNHPAIGPDGGLYIGSTTNEFTGTPLQVFDSDEVPDGFACTFYVLRGPRGRFSR